MAYRFDPPEPRWSKAILVPIQAWGHGYDGRVRCPWWRLTIGDWASTIRWRIWRLQGGRYLDEVRDLRQDWDDPYADHLS
jgi:hypothetical protein